MNRKYLDLSQLNIKRKGTTIKKVISVLAAFSVFVTCYVLIIPAITTTPEDADTFCGMVSHRHDESCYDEEGVLVCGLPEHEHDMLCYTEDVPKDLVCGFSYEHTHNENCYDENEELICTLEEHVHDDSCFVKREEQVFEGSVTGVSLTVTATAGALPGGSSMSVTRLSASRFGLEDYVKTDDICSVRSFRLSFADSSGGFISPDRQIYVTADISDALSGNDTDVIKIDELGNKSVIESTEIAPNVVSFSDYQAASYILVSHYTELPGQLSGECNGMIITVDYDSSSKIPSGAELVVGEFLPGSAEYRTYYSRTESVLSDEDVDSARIFDISIVSGNEVIEPDSPVRVTAKSSGFPGERSDKELRIVHFAEGGTEILVPDDVRDNGSEVTFEQSSFSVVTMASVAKTYTGPFTGANEYTTIAGSILDDNTIINQFDDANEWQIISGKYQNNSSAAKTDVQPHIRGQKNIIPTGEENKFLVYLSLDIDYSNMVEQILTSSGLAMVVESNNKTDKTSNACAQYTHCEEAWSGAGEQTATPLLVEQDARHDCIWNIMFWIPDIDPSTGRQKTGNGQDGSTASNGDRVFKGLLYLPEPVSIVRWSSKDTYQQGYLCAKLKHTTTSGQGDWFHVGRAQKASAQSNCDIYLEQQYYEDVLSNLTNVEIGTMVDNMGNTVDGEDISFSEGIIATRIVASAVNGQLVSDNATITDGGKSITWTPTASSLNTNNPEGWYENIAELLYEIEYTPATSTGMTNGGTTVTYPADAQIYTNQSTAISYRTTRSSGTEEDGVLNLTSPVITGMLYEIDVHKVDNNGENLPGATFELFTQEGITATVVATETSGEDGMVRFDNLPIGTYYVRESNAPQGYKKDSQVLGPYTLCFTTSRQNPSATANPRSDSLTGQGSLEEAVLDENLVFTNEECPSAVLPETGGPGIYLFYTAGFILTVSASVILFKKRRRVIRT